VVEFGVVPAGDLGGGALGQRLAQLHAPLVERIDVPDHALHEYAVLVQRDQCAQRVRRESFGEDGVARPVALERAVRH